ncbi:polyhydroxyalkanoic acid synthase [Kineobactrum salinum]|uniref:Polyhydroxyalkanoic acid synthase n=2 Tax=Kineobactrum salinum TaxID=2708301 RepID=A0A6C0UA24_9GAMM|nr:polyhydroxyalkanoic acid synthase [Kineobactrum salinum]
MPVEELREAARQLAAKLERKHGVRSSWQGDNLRIRGSGVDGELSFGDGVVDISVQLGLLASAFRKPLQAEVQRYLDEMVS